MTDGFGFDLGSDRLKALGLDWSVLAHMPPRAAVRWYHQYFCVLGGIVFLSLRLEPPVVEHLEALKRRVLGKREVIWPSPVFSGEDTEALRSHPQALSCLVTVAPGSWQAPLATRAAGMWVPQQPCCWEGLVHPQSTTLSVPPPGASFADLGTTGHPPTGRRDGGLGHCWEAQGSRLFNAVEPFLWQDLLDPWPHPGSDAPCVTSGKSLPPPAISFYISNTMEVLRFSASPTAWLPLEPIYGRAAGEQSRPELGSQALSQQVVWKEPGLGVGSLASGLSSAQAPSLPAQTWLLLPARPFAGAGDTAEKETEEAPYLGATCWWGAWGCVCRVNT